jgi:hypothetical protein
MDAETAKKKGIGDALCNALSLLIQAQEEMQRAHSAACYISERDSRMYCFAIATIATAMKQAHELSVSLRAIE